MKAYTMSKNDVDTEMGEPLENIAQIAFYRNALLVVFRNGKRKEFILKRDAIVVACDDEIEME